MTKGEIIVELARRCGVPQTAVRQFYDELNVVIMEGLRNEHLVKIKGLGTFKTVSVKARKSVSINGGEEIEIPAHDKLTFTAEKGFAEMVNEPLAHLEVVELDDSPAEEIPTEGDYMMSARMKKLGEEAEVLKGLLGEINGTEVSGETEHLPLQGEHDAGETEQAPSVQDCEKEEIQVETEHAPSLQDDGEEENTERKITHGGMLGRVFLCVLLLLLVGFGVFYWVRFSDNDVATEEEKPVLVREERTEPQVKEEVASEPIVEKPAEESEVAKPVAEKLPSGNPTLDELRKIKVDYSQTIGTETVREGSRLTMISLRAFGDKRFWIYIYLANRDQLTSPGNIQTGMIIKIPKLDSRLTDASNPDCLKLAKELEERYVK